MRTSLQDRLAGGGRPDPLTAFRVARRAFQAGRRVDMTALAAELGVNRATVYRWVGSREELLTEIIWSLAQRTVEASAERARDRAAADPDHPSELAVRLTLFVEDTLAHPGMRRFLAEEGEFAMRLLTLSSSAFQRRFIALVDTLAAAETAAGGLVSPLPPADLAFTVVRVVESFVYLKLITGEEPDGARAGRVLRSLLPGPAAARTGRAGRA
ncbi:QsdR family transcriptional regulator [Pseudonocardia sp. WMMC193]|uniref:QsdR family transcriptional regulator n=1 Tax=Pseudonocardia sp. WMMC193 TaxID=2911965 RepID=UPI001EEF2F63|nr:QsdR family transcriptional regulator [Pseudonocardia sp. WMMC193]MCF7549808.1 TetR/AcrR family transcriptional regulator [Pseudonocardia sp. WMMC193]